MNNQSTAPVDGVLTSGEIRYSQVWEDHAILSKALQITSDDHVISIASAGDNALALLLDEPKSLTMVDINPAQTALCSLKIAGIKHLEYDDFVGMLGARACDIRWELAQSLLSEVPAEASAYWTENRELVESGLMGSGRLETFFRTYQEQHLARVHDAETVRGLLNADTLALQVQYFNQVIATPAFVADFVGYFGRENFAKHGRSLEQFEHVEGLDVGEYLFDRFRFVCTKLPLNNNFYVENFLTSSYADLSSGPMYLRPSAFARLKDLVGRVQVVTGKIDEYLEEAPQGHYSKANLSDIFEYLSPGLTRGIMEVFAARFRQNGRLAYWNFLVPRGPDVELAGRIEVDHSLSRELWLQDRSWGYRDFQVAMVGPAGD